MPLPVGQRCSSRTWWVAAAGPRADADHRPGLGAGGEAMLGQYLVFEGGKERLGCGVIEARADPPHGLLGAEFVLAQRGERGRRVGGSAVSMEDYFLDLRSSATHGGGDLDRIAGQ